MPTAKISASQVRAARGGIWSAADSSSDAPATWASDGPNITSADSSGNPVEEYTSVASASPVTVDAATCADEATKRAVNSGTRNSSV